jgi:serine kinase of HPr protein (carbohydrate metabolism regulator)
MSRSVSSETVHATCVAIQGRGILLHGASGAGKSDLALRLVDRGAAFVSDDYTLVRRDGARLIATAPQTIAGMMEVRGLGIVDLPSLASAPVALMIALDEPVERMPAETMPTVHLAGVPIPVIALAALEPSAPIKVELALRLYGLALG